MNWWNGSKKDSDLQASERNSRAARRAINSLSPLVLSSDDDEQYQDCDTSLLYANVDGADDQVLDDNRPRSHCWRSG